MNLPILLKAQPPTFDDESPYGVTDVPFDDNVWWLVAAGLCYGAFMMIAYKNLEKLKKH